MQRLVTRPHDVAAVYEFLQRLESAVVGGRRPVGAGRPSGLGAEATDLGTAAR